MENDKQFGRAMYKDLIIQHQFCPLELLKILGLAGYGYLLGMVNCLAPQLWSYVVYVGHHVHIISRMENLDLKT